MRELYSIISELKNKKDCILITGVEGEAQGEKLLLTGDSTEYRSGNADLLNGISDTIKDVQHCELINTEAGTLFIEKLGIEGRIIVCGAGTVGLEVIKLGKQLGYPVTVLEDRKEYADAARKLGADDVICTDFETAFSSLNENSSDYFIVVTREHRYDRVCLEKILSRKHAYVGMMASRNRARILKETLAAEGIPEKLVESVQSPVGLSINAETPAEIAVSIFAQIISHRNEKKSTQGFSKEILKDIISKDSDERIILATIIKRTGSAPRDTGSKMLIFEDGSITGSIGGGFIETSVRKLASEMFDNDIKTDMYETPEESEEAKLCGGYETVYLEMI